MSVDGEDSPAVGEHKDDRCGLELPAGKRGQVFTCFRPGHASDELERVVPALLLVGMEYRLDGARFLLRQSARPDRALDSGNARGPELLHGRERLDQSRVGEIVVAARGVLREDGVDELVHYVAALGRRWELLGESLRQPALHLERFFFAVQTASCRRDAGATFHAGATLRDEGRYPRLRP